MKGKPFRISDILLGGSRHTEQDNMSLSFAFNAPMIDQIHAIGISAPPKLQGLCIACLLRESERIKKYLFLGSHHEQCVVRQQ